MTTLPHASQDAQTTLPGGGRAKPPAIDGVTVHELGNILTRSGFMTEIFRSDFPWAGFSIRQINWVELNPGAVTDWHYHVDQTDHLLGVSGNIKLALMDGRPGSPTEGVREIIRLGALRPVVVTVPPGVWHGLRNESGAPAGYLNLADQLYIHNAPDNFRLPPDSPDIAGLL